MEAGGEYAPGEYPSQGKETGTEPGAGTGGSRSIAGGISLNMGFIKTPPGLLMIINMVILFLAWCIMAGWRGSVYQGIINDIGGISSFYLVTTVIPWLMFVAFFVILLLNIHTKLAFINFPLTILINCCFWALFLLISSSIVTNKARNLRGKHSTLCDFYNCGHFEACAVFGFAGVVGMGLQAFLHFREWRMGSS